MVNRVATSPLNPVPCPVNHWLVAAAMARSLGLRPAPSWHSQRDRIGEFGSWLSLVSGSLGKIGQDLVGNGFLRLLGTVGNNFANSSKMNYQWRPRVFRLTGVPEKKKPLERISSTMSSDSMTADTPSSAVSEYLSGWNPLNNPRPNETPSDKLRREAREADERYKASVKKLDALRCNLEEAMVDNLKFMERCELDRLKAIKAVILDFSGAISNVIPALQSTVDNMMLFQETVQPLGDLRYLLENYRTGHFVPKVLTYENYYNSVDGKPKSPVKSIRL